MTSLRDVRAFVSSTKEDLQRERDAAFRAITRLELIPVVMEDFGAHSRPALDVCRSKVESCRYFVLILGLMYGSTYDDGVSYTEHEYRCAMASGAKVKVFMRSDNVAVPGSFVEKGEGAVKLEKFKEELRGKHTVQSFETPEQLSMLIKDTLSEELRKNVQAPGPVTVPAPSPVPAPNPTPAPVSRKAPGGWANLRDQIDRVLASAGVKAGQELDMAQVGQYLNSAGVRWKDLGYSKFKAMLEDFSTDKGGFLSFKPTMQNGVPYTLVIYRPDGDGKKRGGGGGKTGAVDPEGPAAKAAAIACDAALASSDYARPSRNLADEPGDFATEVFVPADARSRLAALLKDAGEREAPSILAVSWAVARDKGAIRVYESKTIFPVPLSENVAESGFIEVSLRRSTNYDPEKPWMKPWYVSFVSNFVLRVKRSEVPAPSFRPIDALCRFTGSARVPESMLDELAELALEEQWTWPGSSAGRKRITLESYLKATFTRLAWQDGLITCPKSDVSHKKPSYQEKFAGGAHVSISTDGTFAAFNTGLIGETFNDIYACLRREKGAEHFTWAGFCTSERSDLNRELIRKLPRFPFRAKYFSAIGELLYDPDRTLVVNVEHILVHNLDRLPTSFLRRELGGLPGFAELFDRAESDPAQRGALLARLRQTIKEDRTAHDALENGFSNAVKRARKLVAWDYKMAIPSYYPAKNELNFLLPLCFGSSLDADAAMVVELLESGNYEGQTALALPQAYADARCIARPASEWLRPPR